MERREDLEALVDTIYAAAFEPGNWGDVVRRVGTRIGATSATSLWFGRGGQQLVRAEIWNVDPEALVEYQAHHLAFCPRYRASQGLSVGQVYDDQSIRQGGEGRVRDYYAFMDRYELGLARIALAEKRPGLTIGMNFYNRAGDGLSRQGARVLRLLAPHFRRACNLTLAMGNLAGWAALGETWFNASTAALTLDRDRRVVRVNSAAEAILAEADGLSLRQGRLVADSVQGRARLDREIERVIHAPRDGPADLDAFILLPRPSGLPPLALSVTPLLSGSTTDCAIVTIAPTVPRIAPMTLRKAFGLTESEACIAAAIAEGKTPETIAAERAVSLHTVRSQLKAIFARLEVSSQSELVSRVTAASLSVRL